MTTVYTHRAVHALVIPAIAEEGFGIETVQTILKTERYTSRADAEDAARAGGWTGDAEDHGEGYFTPAGAMEWARNHPGRPIAAGWVEEIAMEGGRRKQAAMRHLLRTAS